MTKNKIFKCALCSKKKQIKEKHEIYSNKVCNRCFNKLSNNIPTAIREAKSQSWIKNILNKMNK
jgi:ribosomal protein L37AE/L43A